MADIKIEPGTIVQFVNTEGVTIAAKVAEAGDKSLVAHTKAGQEYVIGIADITGYGNPKTARDFRKEAQFLLFGKPGMLTSEKLESVSLAIIALQKAEDLLQQQVKAEAGAQADEILADFGLTPEVADSGVDPQDS